MKRVSVLRQRLFWRLLLSYLVIVVVGVVVLAGTAQFVTPAAVARHAAHMEAAMGDDPRLVADLYESFAAGVNEVLAFGAMAASLAAVIVSVFVAGRIVRPIHAMMQASRRIAGGDYGQRVQVLGQDELGALAQSFNRMAETLEQTEERRMELIGNVAHELRTPLAGIRSSMEGLVDGVLPAEPETFVAVQREAARLQRLVRDLEELSRAEAGQIPLDLRPVAVADLIRTAVERLAPQYEDKGVTLEAGLPSASLQATVDQGRVVQVLINLLGNALQYTGPGGRVVVKARPGDREVVVTVSDNGIGIAPDHLPHLFERFYRVDKSRSRSSGGSGIGLTIARHLVEAHGGQIWAQSAGPGQGSTFTFTLPIT